MKSFIESSFIKTLMVFHEVKEIFYSLRQLHQFIEKMPLKLIQKKFPYVLLKIVVVKNYLLFSDLVSYFYCIC